MTHLPALAGLVLLTAASGLAGLSLGAFPIPVADAIAGALSPQQGEVLWSIRVPRLLLAGLVGAGMAVSGAALQGLFRNPLADPGLMGISLGAALAVGVLIVFAGSFAGDFFAGYGPLLAFAAAAFAGGVLTCLVIFRIARIGGRVSVSHMLLAGIAVNAIAAAGIGLINYVSDDQQLRTLVFWMMGSLNGAMWPSAVIGAGLIVPGIILLFRQAAALNILQLGEEESRYLGLAPDRIKRRVVTGIALCVGTAVALSGAIGFIGLVVPHLIRLTAGPDHRALLPLSALLGASLLMIADTLARTLVSPAEMPVGILTSLIGGPYFLWLLTRQYRPGITP